MVELSGSGIAAIVALVLSLLLGNVAAFKTWWAVFVHKREIIAGAGLVVAVALVALHYAGALNLGLGAFGWRVVWQAIGAWVALVGSAQIAYTAQNSRV